jgi:hypothetical protein
MEATLKANVRTKDSAIGRIALLIVRSHPAAETD